MIFFDNCLIGPQTILFGRFFARQIGESQHKKIPLPIAGGGETDKRELYSFTQRTAAFSEAFNCPLVVIPYTPAVISRIAIV